jgi:hypothetical protein
VYERLNAPTSWVTQLQSFKLSINVTKNPEGDKVMLSVEQYFTSVQHITSGKWPINVTKHFQTHLPNCLQMKANNYSNNTAAALKDP